MAYSFTPEAPPVQFQDICAHAAEWQPGLYSAGEAVESVLRDLRTQDEEIARLMGPPTMGREAAFRF